MRRPLVPPDQAAAVVRRNTWQGMAQGRVPAAYPVPRVRLPRMLGGLKGPKPVMPDTIDYIYERTGFGGVGPLTVTLEAGDAACAVLHGSIADIVLPSGWTNLTEFTSASGYRLCIAAITNAPAGGHIFTFSGTSGHIDGRRLGYGSGAPVGGTWDYVHGPHRDNLRSFSFTPVDPAWTVGWQAPACTGVAGGGLEDVPPATTFFVGEGASEVMHTYSWPKSTAVADYLVASGDFLAPAPTTDYADGNIYAFDHLGAYGVASSMSVAVGWTP